MPILLANVTFNTARGLKDSKGVTPAAGSYPAWLTGVVAHIEPLPASKYATLPQQALESEFLATVDWGTDIGEGDLVSGIYLLRDGKTPWPGNLPSVDGANTPAAAMTWRVAYVKPSTPGVLAYTEVYLARVVGSGPTAIQG